MLKNKNRILKPFLAPKISWWYNLSSAARNPLYGQILGQIGAITAALLVLLGIGGCGTTKYVPIESKEQTKVEVRDSVIYKDSIIYIPQERIVEVVPSIDTLFMEIETAEATAYLDTAILMLRGELKSKKKETVKYIERIEVRERIDTTYIQIPQPYPVEVTKIPKWLWWSLIFNIINVLLIAFKLYLKIKP